MGGIGFHHTFHQLVASIEREMTTHLCTECGKSSTEEVLLLIHQTRIHDKTSYSCDECGADVIGKVSLSNHKRRHKIPAVKNLRKHKCEKCPYESEVKSNVNRHKKQVHEQKPDKVKKSWNCDKCETKHTSKYGYDRHVKTHEKRSSQSENQVKKVKSAAGFGTFVREKKVRVADKHLCSECSKTFNSAFNLKRHMVSELHKKKPKKKKSRTTVMRRVRKFLSESDNLKEINRQRKNSDTSGLIDATLKKSWHKFLKY